MPQSAEQRCARDTRSQSVGRTPIILVLYRDAGFCQTERRDYHRRPLSSRAIFNTIEAALHMRSASRLTGAARSAFARRFSRIRVSPYARFRAQDIITTPSLLWPPIF